MPKESMDGKTLKYQCSGCWRLCAILTDRSQSPKGCPMPDTPDDAASWRKESNNEKGRNTPDGEAVKDMKLSDYRGKKDD